MKTRQTIIFHIDGDAFFASCEQSTNMSLRGKPIVVGRERGIATAYSYEAKALGVTRGMRGSEIARDFPSVRLVSSDYRKYGLYSRRFKNIVRTYTHKVEGMSVDECYADVTDVVGDFDQAERLARILQNELNTKLGMTFSVGVGPNKTIAKIASGMNKPCGVTVVRPDTIPEILHRKSISAVCGIGVRSTGGLNGQKIYTIGDFCSKSIAWVKDYCSKPYVELYRELQGEYIRPLDLVIQKPKSISKIRAFGRATSNREQLMTEFSRNAEIVAKKLFAQEVQGKTMTIGMKLPRIPGTGIPTDSDEVFYVSMQLTPEQPIRHTKDILDIVSQYFDNIYHDKYRYRATYIGVHGLGSVDAQLDLFIDEEVRDTQQTLADMTQGLEKKYGRAVVQRGMSLGAAKTMKPIDIVTDKDGAGTPLLCSREGDKILEIPFIGIFS